MGLGREIVNYTLGREDRPLNSPTTTELDLADGGHYNNLGIESLVNRGCGYIILVDAEHDVEAKTARSSNQKYNGLKTLLSRHHIKIPKLTLSKVNKADEAVHVFKRNATIPDIVYIKLKSSKAFDKQAKRQEYNQPGFLVSLFEEGKSRFDSQFSTAKLDYDFSEHRNLSELGRFIVTKHQSTIKSFAQLSK